jgi:acyl-CoA thioester hydrolase
MTLPKSAPMSIRPEWIDFNGHLNMAYYMVLFDTSLDELFAPMGFGPEYVTTRNMSLFATDVHLTYQRELKVSDKVYVNFRLLDLSPKAMHYGTELYHASEHFLSSTMEGLSLHVDMQTRKTCPFPQDIYSGLEKILAQHQQLPPNPVFGKRVEIKRKI